MEVCQVVTWFVNGLYGREGMDPAIVWLVVRYLAVEDKPVQRWFYP